MAFRIWMRPWPRDEAFEWAGVSFNTLQATNQAGSMRTSASHLEHRDHPRASLWSRDPKGRLPVCPASEHRGMAKGEWPRESFSPRRLYLSDSWTSYRNQKPRVMFEAPLFGESACSNSDELNGKLLGDYPLIKRWSFSCPIGRLWLWLAQPWPPESAGCKPSRRIGRAINATSVSLARDERTGQDWLKQHRHTMAPG